MSLGMPRARNWGKDAQQVALSIALEANRVAYLISGVVVIEVVFVYPGVGQAMIDAVRNRDVPVIQACALIFATAYIGFNLIADVISIVSNPRLLHPR